MEMTRQRLHESLGSALYEACPACKGHGQVKTPLTMSVDIQRRLSSILQRNRPEQKDLGSCIPMSCSACAARTANCSPNFSVATSASSLSAWTPAISASSS